MTSASASLSSDMTTPDNEDLSCGRSSRRLCDMAAVVDMDLTPKYAPVPMVVAAGLSTSSNANNTTAAVRPGSSFVLLAIVEGRGHLKGEVGVAWMDIRYETVYMMQFLDSATDSRPLLRTHIQLADPVEVIVGDSSSDGALSAVLSETVKAACACAAVTKVHRRYFKSDIGAQLINSLGLAELCSPIGILLSKSLALAAAGALVKYVEYVQKMLFRGNSLRFIFNDMDRCCLVDAHSWRNLEILNRMDDGRRRVAHREETGGRSLLECVDLCVTNLGGQLLRTNLLQPTSCSAEIERRLDAVHELLTNRTALDNVRSTLRKSHDLAHLLAICVRRPRIDTVKSGEQTIVMLLHIRQTLAIAPAMGRMLRSLKSRLWQDIEKLLDERALNEVGEMIDEVFDTRSLRRVRKNSLEQRNQRIYAVRKGLRVELDIMRKTYSELLLKLRQHFQEELEAAFSGDQVADDIRLAFSASRGFHYAMQITHAKAIRLPPVFINVVRNRSSITFSSRELMQFNERITQTVDEVMLQSSIVVSEVSENLRNRLPFLYRYCDVLAQSDFVCCLAMFSSQNARVRPRFGRSYEIKGGRHPLLDAANPEAVVENDTTLSTDVRFSIITGPNMAGKSTYLRQVCQFQLLAQLGCFVPAKSAQVPIMKRIFARVGYGDSPVDGQSAFTIEMAEIAGILMHCDADSLVVVDELARSTAAEEGIAISWAISEELLRKKSFVLFATHYLDLCMLDINCSSAINFHFAPQLERKRTGELVLNAQHKLLSGPYSGPLYGFELAELTTFPTSVIEEARKTAHHLRSTLINGRDEALQHRHALEEDEVSTDDRVPPSQWDDATHHRY